MCEVSKFKTFSHEQLIQDITKYKVTHHQVTVVHGSCCQQK